MVGVLVVVWCVGCIVFDLCDVLCIVVLWCIGDCCGLVLCLGVGMVGDWCCVCFG